MKGLLKRYIKQIIKEGINEVYDENDLKSTFLKRLCNIPFEEQEKLFLAEMCILLPYSTYSPLFNNRIGINETKEKLSLPLKEVKQAIIQQYGFKDWQFIIRTFENNVDIAILVPNTDTYIKQLISDMKIMGYFCSLKVNISYNGLTYKAMRFEPLYQPNIREQEIGDNTLYHLTPMTNIESIRSHSLIPLSQNKYFNYPNRIYFLKTTISAKHIRDIAKKFRNAKGTDEDYVLLIIDLNKVPNNVSFHNDPLFDNAVYTYDKVPSTAIVNIIELKINK